MAEFAHADELETHLGLQPGGIDNDRLQQAVELASAAVQSYCRQRLELVEDDEVTLSGSWERDLYLPERPVIDVSSISVGIGGAVQSLDPAIYTWHRQGRVSYFNGDSSIWMGPVAGVTVVYTHGYEVIPDDIKLATLRVAARLYDRRAGEEQVEQVGSYSHTIDTATEYVEAEKQLLSRYRRGARSISIGTGA